MFLLIESKEEIAKAQRQLETTIQREFVRTDVKNIGYPSGRIKDATVYTNDEYWFQSDDLSGSAQPNPSRLNLFGRFRKERDLQISVQFNIPYDGSNRRLAGFFARDSETGSIYLFHSGGVGGGKKGVGKNAFLNWSPYRLEEVLESAGSKRRGILVMPIDARAATPPLILYIKKIDQFKELVRSGAIDTPELQRRGKIYDDVYPEPRGRRKGRRAENIDYLSRHGEVIDALHEWRRSCPLPKDGRLVKDVLIDLGVMVADDLTEVFEAKTSTARSDVYSAIGQLMVHGFSNKCRRVIVLPNDERIAPDLLSALQRLGIQLIRFTLNDFKATILV